VARLERQPLLQLLLGQLQLVLVLVDARAVVVDRGRIGGVQLQGPVELRQGVLVHPVQPQGDAGNGVNAPVIRARAQKLLDAMTGALLFAAGEHHVDAVEVGLGRAGVHLERPVEGAPRAEHMHLASQAVAHVLQMRHAEPAPGGGELRIVLQDPLESLDGAVEIAA